MRGKVGAAHFEMIIGFVFFMGFVMFLFVFLSPWESSSLSNSALEGLHISFLEEVGTTLSSVFIDANIPGEQGQGQDRCFSIELPPEIFEYVDTDRVSLVKELGGVSIESELSGTRLKVGQSSNFFRIAISPEFASGVAVSCNSVPNYELGSIVEIKIVSYIGLGEMKARYDSDYDSLKDDLNVADIFDFAIIFEGMSEMNMEPSIEISAVVEILAKDYVVKVLRSSGQVSNERVSIRIW